MSLSLGNLPRPLPGPFSLLEELVPFSKVRLIAFDLDGTLLKAPDEAPGERIQKLQRSKYLTGARVTVATGRTFFGARKSLLSFGELGQVPVVLYNGSVVLQPGRNCLIAHRNIAVTPTNFVINRAKEQHAEVFVYIVQEIQENPDRMTSSWGCLERVMYYGTDTIPAKDFNGMAVEPGPAPLNSPATAILILPSANTDVISLMRDLTELDEISVTSSGGKYIELRPAGSSKAVGMADLARALNLKSEEVLAVGDNDNDVELLKWAGIGVTVDGASSQAVAASDYITRFGAERGAIEVLDLIRRAKRLNQ